MPRAVAADLLGGVKCVRMLFLGLCLAPVLGAWQVALPPRPADAPAGREFALRVTDLPLAAREDLVVAEILRGNVPEGWRTFRKVAVGEAVLHVAPDYLAVGSDTDFVRWPLTPAAAQRVADALDCTLPTPRIVDLIYRAATAKLEPRPLAPGPAMTRVAAFVEHDDAIAATLRGLGSTPAGRIVAGHKKDVVLTPRLAAARGRVAIYGWHRANGSPIQPLFLGHAGTWVDYSHGVRLVAKAVGWRGGSARLDVLLADDRWATLFSDEGPCAALRWDEVRPVVPEFAGEVFETRFFPAGVRAVLNRPETPAPAEPVALLVYAVPAGNTIEQTLGRQRRAPDDDWHFAIQHVAAQVRWLRRNGQPNLVLAVVEAGGRAWTTWRRATPEAGRKIAAAIDALRAEVKPARIVLSGHSAGGAFTFAWIEALERIPDDVERIAFLDSNYAYDATRGHGEKLATWLAASPRHSLYVAAYEDHRARLDGKPFVSESGGIWGRSQAMKADLGSEFPLAETQHGELCDYRSSDGRVVFQLRRNPEATVWHTRLVELNGVIQAWRAGTAAEGKGYEFLGSVTYGSEVAR